MVAILKICFKTTPSTKQGTHPFFHCLPAQKRSLPLLGKNQQARRRKGLQRSPPSQSLPHPTLAKKRPRQQLLPIPKSRHLQTPKKRPVQMVRQRQHRKSPRQLPVQRKSQGANHRQSQELDLARDHFRPVQRGLQRLERDHAPAAPAGGQQKGRSKQAARSGTAVGGHPKTAAGQTAQAQQAQPFRH